MLLQFYGVVIADKATLLSQMSFRQRIANHVYMLHSFRSPSAFNTATTPSLACHCKRFAVIPPPHVLKVGWQLSTSDAAFSQSPSVAEYRRESCPTKPMERQLTLRR